MMERRFSSGQERPHQQSLAYWCLHDTDWHWDIGRICDAAVSLGCPAVELVPPEFWPEARQRGLAITLSHNGMPDPVFAKGLNNPR